jgi:CPA2 family monovalent cation:H+ antiporter-2
MAMATVIETAPLVLDVGAVLLGAATAGYVARRIGLPAIIGYLFVGLMVSPFTPGYTADKDQIAVLADIGVVLLLFEVGIEIDLRRLRREQRGIIWGAPLQILIGLLVATPIFLFLDIPILGALLLALSIGMSSSVVIVNIVRSGKRTTDSGTEDALLGWSVTQDLFGVASAAIVLALFGASDTTIPAALGGLLIFILIAFLSSRVLPKILRMFRWETDLFLIFSVGIGLFIAALGTVLFEIPMALASFVAGLAISQNTDTDQVRKSILPFRDLFQVLFFVVIGTLISPESAIAAMPFTLLLLALLFTLKTLPAFLIAKLAKLKARPGQLGIGLSQVGEFSFVLGSVALVKGAITDTQFTAILLTVVISIVISTIWVRSIHRR